LIRRLTKLGACGVLLIPCLVTGHAAGRGSTPPTVRVQPVPSVQPAALENYDLVSLQRIRFSADHVNLIRSERAVFDQIAQTILKHPGSIIELRGYADGGASPAANNTLSLERATVIARLLTARGVETKRLLILGLGEVDPTGRPLLAEHQRVDVRMFAPPAALLSVQHESAIESLIHDTWGGKIEH
jgi:outer membrane protein OmpA-like peptidoglycan-associated protein